MPLAGNDDGFGLGRGRSQLHNDDDSGRGRNRDDRVHHDAQLAVIRIRLARVQMRDLGYGQHRQQDQTDHRHCRHEAGPDAAFAAENCLKSCQSLEPSTSILQKAPVSLDALDREGLHLSDDFGRVPK